MNLARLFGLFASLKIRSNLPYISPTLLEIDQEMLPQDLTICELCPKSLWILAQNKTMELTCFCQITHSLAYQSSKPQIIHKCDGQIQALLEIEKEKEMVVREIIVVVAVCLGLF